MNHLYKNFLFSVILVVLGSILSQSVCASDLDEMIEPSDAMDSNQDFLIKDKNSYDERFAIKYMKEVDHKMMVCFRPQYGLTGHSQEFCKEVSEED
jgi:hypothetical protein